MKWDVKRKTGLSWRGWAIFWSVAVVLGGGAVVGAIKMKPAFETPAPPLASSAPAVRAPSLKDAAPSSSPAARHHRARPRPASSPVFASIPGAPGTGTPGIAPAPTHRVTSSSPAAVQMPPSTQAAPTTAAPTPTPEPTTSTPSPSGTPSPSSPPSTLPASTATGTLSSSAPSFSTGSGGT